MSVVQKRTAKRVFQQKTVATPTPTTLQRWTAAMPTVRASLRHCCRAAAAMQLGSHLQSPGGDMASRVWPTGQVGIRSRGLPRAAEVGQSQHSRGMPAVPLVWMTVTPMPWRRCLRGAVQCRCQEPPLRLSRPKHAVYRVRSAAAWFMCHHAPVLRQCCSLMPSSAACLAQDPLA